MEDFAEGESVMLTNAPTDTLGRIVEETLEAKAYLNRLPRDLDAGPVILVDPMLATGGSAVAALKMLREAGAIDLRVMCLVAAPEGIARVHGVEPAVPIYAAAKRLLSSTGHS